MAHNAHRHLFGCRKSPCYCKPQAYTVALLLALVFSAIEFWGSENTASWALFADAWHVLTDAAIYGIGLWGSMRVMRRPEDALSLDNFWGGRNAAIQMTIAIGLGISGVVRVVYPGPLVNLPTLLLVALVGFLGNLLVYAILSHVGIGHTHAEGGHEHRDEKGVIARMHTLGDAAASIVVLVVGTMYLAKLLPSALLLRLDGVGTCVIALWLFISAYQAIRRIQDNKQQHH